MKTLENSNLNLTEMMCGNTKAYLKKAYKDY